MGNSAALRAAERTFFAFLWMGGTGAAQRAAERASFYHSVEGDCRRTAGGGAYIFAFCGWWGLAPPCGRLNVHFCILRVVETGTMGGDDNRRWKVSETCETICFLLYKAGFSVRIGGTVYKAL